MGKSISIDLIYLMMIVSNELEKSCLWDDFSLKKDYSYSEVEEIEKAKHPE